MSDVAAFNGISQIEHGFSQGDIAPRRFLGTVGHDCPAGGVRQPLTRQIGLSFFLQTGGHLPQLGSSVVLLTGTGVFLHHVTLLQRHKLLSPGLALKLEAGSGLPGGCLAGVDIVTAQLAGLLCQLLKA